MAGEIIRAVVGAGAARVVAAVTTAAVAEAARRHRTAGVATVALGRAATAGLLLATLTKGEEGVTVQLLGDGPLGTVTVDAGSTGRVRGYVARPEVAAGTVAAAVGHGLVSVIRDLGLRDRYSGSAAIVSGEIDEDLESYLTASEQVESALGCAVVLDGGAVAAAGGVLVQALPGGDGAALVAAARRRLRAGTLDAALAAGTALALAAAALARLDGVEVLSAGPVGFHCPCSRERVVGALVLCGPAEIAAMLRDDGGAEVRCNFCNERYAVGREELERLLS